MLLNNPSLNKNNTYICNPKKSYFVIPSYHYTTMCNILYIGYSFMLMY